MFAFLLAYILPFLRADMDILATLYVMVLVVLALVHSGTYHFNPIMAMFQYHFYSVETAEGESRLLISKHRVKQVTEKSVQVPVVRLTSDVVLCVKDDGRE